MIFLSAISNISVKVVNCCIKLMSTANYNQVIVIFCIYIHLSDIANN